MNEWLYYGSNKFRSNRETVTLPPAMFYSDMLPDNLGANIFWFIEENKVGISDSPASNNLDDFSTKIQDSDGSRVTTIVKPCREDEDGNPRFDPKQVLHFVATEEMVDGEETSVYILSTEQLLETVPSSEAWMRTQDNLQRLFGLAEIDRLEKLLPGELTGQETRRGHREAVSFDPYRYSPGKGGFVEVDLEQGTVVARWFRYEDVMNSAETGSETYSLIESEFKILDSERKILKQVGDTQQFTVEYFPDVDDWVKESQEGTLDHIPRAIENALEDGAWSRKQE